MNVLHPSVEIICFESICSRDPMKNWTLGFSPWLPTAKCIASCNHDVFLEDDHCVSFFKLKFLIPTLRHMFYLRKLSNIYGERDFDNNLEKYTFLWFKNRDFYFWWGKNVWILPKNLLSFSLVDIIFLGTFLL